MFEGNRRGFGGTEMGGGQNNKTDDLSTRLKGTLNICVTVCLPVPHELYGRFIDV